MKDQEILNRVTQQLLQVSNASPTPAGNQPQAASVEQKEAINQVFELFRFNYANQFLKAFPDYDTLIMGKRLWANLLAEYNPALILKAAEACVRSSSFLPSIHDIVQQCAKHKFQLFGLPEVHAAFIEACRAPSPKNAFAWAHPAVYFAGRASDWFFLASAPEEQTFPVYKRNYELISERVMKGEDLEVPLPKALPQDIARPLDKDAQLAHMRELRKKIRL